MCCDELMIKLPEYVTKAMKALNNSGYECYVVGGAIRSAVLNMPVHDYDLTTDALPSQMKTVFHDWHTFDTGIQHGTITVLSDHQPLEITTYRKDCTYQDHRHPDAVQFTSSIEEDCSRRDFTVNAFCYSEEHGFLDFFHGMEDIKHKVIRCIGDPYRRFDEDALRILRAIRFASQLNFTIEDKTAEAILELKDTLSYVSMERINEEFTKKLGTLISIVPPVENSIDSTFNIKRGNFFFRMRPSLYSVHASLYSFSARTLHTFRRRKKGSH